MKLFSYIKTKHYQLQLKQELCVTSNITLRPEKAKNLYELRGVKDFPFSEHAAKKIILDLAILLKKMAKKNLVHRDLKPNNVIYDLEKKHVHLIDYGSASYFKRGEYFETYTGTKSYMPPEYITAKQCSPEQETIWCLGMLTYFVLTGCVAHKTMNEVLSGNQPTHLDNLSLDAQNLIKSMLCIDQRKRPCLKDVLHHTWFQPQKQYTLLKKIKYFLV